MHFRFFFAFVDSSIAIQLQVLVLLQMQIAVTHTSKYRLSCFQCERKFDMSEITDNHLQIEASYMGLTSAKQETNQKTRIQQELNVRYIFAMKIDRFITSYCSGQEATFPLQQKQIQSNQHFARVSIQEIGM
jgi:hypothetical protein